MNDEELVERDRPGQQDRHCLAVLATRMIDADEGAAFDEMAAFRAA